MDCPKCGAQSPNDAAYCIQCVATLHATLPLAGLETSQMCSGCLAPLPVHATFCPECGARAMALRALRSPRQRRTRYTLIGGAILLLALPVVGAVLGIRSGLQAKELRAHYGGGTAALQAGDCDTALQEYAWVMARDPVYADTQILHQVAQAQAGRAGLYAQAQADCDRQRWEAAIAALEPLEAQAPDYRPPGGQPFAVHRPLPRRSETGRRRSVCRGDPTL